MQILMAFEKEVLLKLLLLLLVRPPISSVAARGEWSLGKILGIYWHFAPPGNQYLGRCLAGLDADAHTFGVLPPHFLVNEPEKEECVKQALQLLYPRLMENWGLNPNVDPTGILIRVLPSLVYHSDFLKNVIRRNPGHPFSKIALLQQSELLAGLKKIVTVEPKGVVVRPTGIPPHVTTNRKLTNIHDLLKDMFQEVKDMTSSVKSAVSQAMEDRALEQGHLTSDRLKSIVTSYETNMQGYVTNKFEELKQWLPTPGSQNATTDSEPIDKGMGSNFADGDEEEITSVENGRRERVRYRVYTYQDKIGWHVPMNFEFPLDTKLKEGWRMWVQGLPSYEIMQDSTKVLAAPICPFRLLKSEFLPKTIRPEFRLY